MLRERPSIPLKTWSLLLLLHAVVPACEPASPATRLLRLSLWVLPPTWRPMAPLVNLMRTPLQTPQTRIHRGCPRSFAAWG